MRFIGVNSVEEGMILAHPLYDAKGTILLNTNVVLTNRMIKSVRERGYKGLYIYDKISEGINITENITPRTKIEALQSLNNKSLDDCIYVAHTIVEDIKNVDKIYTTLNIINDFDYATYMHSINVAIYAGTFGIIYGLTPERVELLVASALLHDIGKSQIPIDIINKPGKLNADERELINLHPEYGYNMLKGLESIPSVVRVSVLEHHENSDGSGYPNQYKDKKIYLFAKIIHICDVYEAMLSKRVYKERINPTEILEYMMSQSGKMFNEELLELFVRSIIPYPEGMLVRLSTKESAIVKKNNKNYPTRPMVVTTGGKIINLIKHNDILITGYDGI